LQSLIWSISPIEVEPEDLFNTLNGRRYQTSFTVIATNAAITNINGGKMR